MNIINIKKLSRIFNLRLKDLPISTIKKLSTSSVERYDVSLILYKAYGMRLENVNMGLLKANF